ncbi:MAG: SMC family ATPase, partial [Cyanobium sp.]
RVSLEFSTGDRRYLVERSAAHSAPKARGEGRTEKPPTAAHFRLHGTQREAIASRNSEVTREVEGLVGLSAAQFRQVILLPQGKFAEVLRARAEERETLLKTLFNTEMFERAGQWLEEKARGARSALAEAARGQEVLRQQAAQEWRPYQPAGEEGAVPEDQAALDRLESRIQEIAIAAATTLEQANSRLAGAQQVRQATTLLLDRWTRRDRAASRLMELEGKAEVVKDYRQRLKRAEQAEALRPTLEAERTAQGALSLLQERLQSLLRQVIRARDDAQALPMEVVLLDLQRIPSLEDLNGAANALAGRRAEVVALLKQAREAAAARTKAQSSADGLQQVSRVLAQGQAGIVAKQRERQATLEACTRARTARDQQDGLQRAAEDAEQRALAAEAVRPAQQREQEAIAAHNQAEAKLNQAHAALLELRRRQIQGMAAELAQGLVMGQPCPVCGATTHPAPNPGDGETIGLGQITEAERDVSAASQWVQEMAAARALAQSALQRVREKAGAAAEAPEAARAAAKEAQAALVAAKGLAQELKGLERALAEQDLALVQAQERCQEAKTQIALLQTAGGEAEARALALEADIRQALGDGVDPQGVLEAFEPLERLLKELATSRQAHSLATSRLVEASERLAHELAASSFATGQEVELALKGADATRRQLWAQRIEAYEREVIELRGLLSSADLAGLPQEPPDLAQAEAALEAADAARVRALERLSEARGCQEDLTRLAKEHRAGDVLRSRLQRDA